MLTGRKGELLLLLGGHIGPGVGGPKSSEIISHQGKKTCVYFYSAWYEVTLYWPNLTLPS